MDTKSFTGWTNYWQAKLADWPKSIRTAASCFLHLNNFQHVFLTVGGICCPKTSCCKCRIKKPFEIFYKMTTVHESNGDHLPKADLRPGQNLNPDQSLWRRMQVETDILTCVTSLHHVEPTKCCQTSHPAPWCSTMTWKTTYWQKATRHTLKTY